MKHKSGFVNIIGRPNVGKSTLMNQLVGEKLSIITSKAQTTRHRILGIVNGDDFQVVLSDTPGMIYQPASELHRSMMGFVSTSLVDADVVLFMTDLTDDRDETEEVVQQLNKAKVPRFLLINKTDLGDQEKINKKHDFWTSKVDFDHVFKIAAITGKGVEDVFKQVLETLPEHPAYFDKDTLTDKPEKFFVSEIVREKIFTNYRQEIPYAAEVVVEEFKEEEDIIRIRAVIYVERKTQKSIIIGKGGSSIKKVGIEARKDIEAFFGKQVYLETFVKVRDNWRNNDLQLKNFGYKF